MFPEFPHFRPIQIEDRQAIHERLGRYQPQTSEMTFTNLFIWRSHYGFQWAVYEDWLLILCTAPSSDLYLLPPIGPPSRRRVVRMALEWIRNAKGMPRPRIERADRRLVEEIHEENAFFIEAIRDQFDYVYRRQSLVDLAGRKYHAKRNHITRFRMSHPFDYVSLHPGNLEACLELSKFWCELRRCEEDLNLTGEGEAVREALTHFLVLQLQGGAIVINEEIKAFTLGEKLNEETVVVHIEKADPEIQGLYAVINQQFCQNAWPTISFVNREQDLGEPGLRQAKLSYHPEYLIEKFRITLKE
jgi:hypothetical protein